MVRQCYGVITVFELSTPVWRKRVLGDQDIYGVILLLSYQPLYGETLFLPSTLVWGNSTFGLSTPIFGATVFCGY